MKKFFLIIFSVFIFLLLSLTSYGQDTTFSPFYEMMKNNLNLYELYNNGDINIYNEKIALEKGTYFTLNGIMADKGHVFFLYTLEGDVDHTRLSISSSNFKPFYYKDTSYGYSGGMSTKKIGDKTYGILEYDVSLFPDKDNTITIHIKGNKNLYREFIIPFSEESFIKSSIDFSPKIHLQGYRYETTISRVISSPLGLTLFIQYKEDDKTANHLFKRYVDIKDSLLYTRTNTLNFKSGGGNRISDNLYLDYATFSPIDKNTSEIYFYVDDNTYTIKLPTAPSAFSAQNTAELASLIGSNKIIYLENKDYDLSEIISGNDNLIVSKVFDGNEVIIKSINNLTIIGKENTRLLVKPRYANVLSFKNCNNIKLYNLTIGHTIEKGHCVGGVIKATNTSNLLIDNCKLFGCGAEGLTLESCKKVDFLNSRIYECTYGIMTIVNSTDLNFKNNIFHDNKEYYGVDVKSGRNISFIENKFYNNKITLSKSLINISPSCSNVSFKDNIFKNNKCGTTYN